VTDQAQQSPTEATTEATPSADYDARAAQVFGNDGETPAQADAPATAAPDEAAQRRAERRKQLDALIAEDARKLDDHAHRRKLEAEAKRAEQLQRDLEERDAKLKTAIDPSGLDEAGFFSLAEKLGVSPKKLGEWLQKQQTNPERIAAEVAKREIDPALVELREQNAALQKRLDAFEQSTKTEKQRSEAMGNAERMMAFTKANVQQAPLSAAFLENYGVEQFVALANGASEGIPMSAGWEQHLLDAMEDRLSELGKIFKPQSGSPERKQAPPTNHGAAKPMTTISNTFAQARASVVDEDADFAKLPYDERAKRVFSGW
jgi:hypothetical protein